MSYRVKCRECLGCMIAIWVDNNRYWHCSFCKLYYAGRDDELRVVEDPFKKINKPEPIDKDDLNETQN